MIALDLAAQSQAGCVEQVAELEHRFFGLGHLIGFTFDELHSAGGAAGLAAAGVELVDFCFVREGVDQAFILGHFKASGGFNSQFWHGWDCDAQRNAASMMQSAGLE